MKLIVGNSQVILVLSPLCSLESCVYHITAHYALDATDKVVCVLEARREVYHTVSCVTNVGSWIL
jgi:hypothetical protein